MKNINLLLLAFILIFSACRKEEIILDDPVITQSPPTVVDGAFFSGKVVDIDGLAVATKIEVYQNDGMVGTVSSDLDGNYNTQNLVLLEGKDVTFAIENENYANKYKRIKTQQTINENQDIRLINKSANPLGPDNPLFNPGSADLVKVFGTFTDKHGDPIQNADALILYDITIPGSEPKIFYGLFDKTDDDGYFEFLVPNDKELFFYSTPDRDNVGPFCFTTISQEEAFDVISPLIGFDELGILSEDTEVFEKENLFIRQEDFTVHGDLLSCDGVPVNDGKVSLEVKYWSNGVQRTQVFETEEFDENGEYWFDFSICSDLFDLKIVGETADGYFVSISINDVIGDGMHLAPLKACDENNGSLYLRSTMELAIGNDYFFQEIVFVHQALGQQNNFSVVGSNSETGFVLLDIQNLKEGENPIRQFVVDYLDNNPEAFSFNAPSGELIATVTSIQNGIIDGYIEGIVMTSGLGEQTINAKFEIKYE